MSAFTKKNLRDVEDQAPGFGVADRQSACFATEALGAEATGVAYMGVKPGQRQAFAHRHENAEEVYVILSGSGTLKLDEELVAVAPLAAIRIAPGVTRAFEAGDEGLQYLAFGPRHQGDGELVHEGFWD